MKIGIVDHPQRFMRHKRPQGSNSVTNLAHFNREFINMILPRQGAVNSDTQKPSGSVINNISIFITDIYLGYYFSHGKVTVLLSNSTDSSAFYT
jgi:hypothetical protein